MSALLLAQSNAPFFAMGGAMIVFLIIALIASIFWVWMLIDCLTGPLPSTEKLIWFLVIFFLHLLGAILYYVVGRSGRAGVT